MGVMVSGMEDNTKPERKLEIRSGDTKYQPAPPLGSSAISSFQVIQVLGIYIYCLKWH